MANVANAPMGQAFDHCWFGANEKMDLDKAMLCLAATTQERNGTHWASPLIDSNSQVINRLVVGQDCD